MDSGIMYQVPCNGPFKQNAKNKTALDIQDRFEEIVCLFFMLHP